MYCQRECSLGTDNKQIARLRKDVNGVVSKMMIDKRVYARILTILIEDLSYG